MTTTGDGHESGEPGKLDRAGRGRNRLGFGAEPGEAHFAGEEHRRGLDPLRQIRASDLAPYTGLGYLSKLFRVIAVLLLVLLVAEVIAGAASDEPDWWRQVLGEASRLLVVAGVLWGIGDLATLLIDVGHDVRAARILLGRQVAHQHAHDPVVVAAAVPSRGGTSAADRGRDEHRADHRADHLAELRADARADARAEARADARAELRRDARGEPRTDGHDDGARAG